MALDVENLIPNSREASLIVEFLDKTFFMKAILIDGVIWAYFLPLKIIKIIRSKLLSLLDSIS
jgi:hypothetical protein